MLKQETKSWTEWIKQAIQGRENLIQSLGISVYGRGNDRLTCLDRRRDL